MHAVLTGGVPVLALVILLAVAVAAVIRSRQAQAAPPDRPAGTVAVGPDGPVAAAVLAEQLRAEGFDPTSMSVHHDPAAQDGLQWRIRIRERGRWLFAHGDTIDAAIAALHRELAPAS